jgi:hypothetical protein
VSKVHLKNNNQKEAQNHTLDFNLFVQQKHATFYENTCSLDELDVKTKSLKNFEVLKF